MLTVIVEDPTLSSFFYISCHWIILSRLNICLKCDNNSTLSEIMLAIIEIVHLSQLLQLMYKTKITSANHKGHYGYTTLNP